MGTYAVGMVTNDDGSAQRRRSRATQTRNYFQALDNFVRVFTIRPGEWSVTTRDTTIIERGFLMTLRDADVVEMALRYGDPVDLLEGSR